MSDGGHISESALLLSGKQVCHRLSIGLSHLHAMKRAGKFPLAPIRLGRSVRYSADDLRRWCEAGCPASAKWNAIEMLRRS